VKINECISEVDFNGTQYFFLAEIISGTSGTVQGEEYMETNKHGGMYIPMWVDIADLSSLNVIPKEVTLKVQSLSG